jgi:DNA-binding Lrp family transcriptional regulator
VRVLSDPLPLTEHPFAVVAQRAEVLEELVLERIRAWLADGIIRRFGARVDHHTAGYPANGMSVWKASPAEEESAARYMAAQPEVSHCYLRDTQPDWDYNLYAMIHGPDQAEVEAVAQRIADNTKIRDHTVLFSVKELKKTAPRYFNESGADRDPP